MWDMGFYMPKAFQEAQTDADQFMGERVNFTGASLEARGLFSLRNWGLQRRKRRREGAFHLPVAQLPSSGCFCNHSCSTQPRVPHVPEPGTGTLLGQGEDGAPGALLSCRAVA